MSVNRRMLMRAIDCCIAEDCKSCPTNNGQNNCVKELLRAAKEYILHLETNQSLDVSGFAKFLIDIGDIADYVKESGGERMTASEAIELLEQCGLNIEQPKHDEVLNIVVEALEKQIPKKPVLRKTPENTKFKLEEYECPVCHHWIGKQAKFCRNCGQALDWSDIGGEI